MNWILVLTILIELLQHYGFLARVVRLISLHQHDYNVKLLEKGDGGLTIGVHDNPNDKTSKHTTFDHNEITKIDENNENNLYTFILKV